MHPSSAYFRSAFLYAGMFGVKGLALNAFKTDKYKKPLLLLITAAFWFAQYVYSPLLTPYLTSELKMASLVVGVIVGAYGISQLVLRVPLGMFADMAGNHRLIIILSCFLAAAASVLRIASHSAAAMFMANILSGAASSGWVSFTVLYSTFYNEDDGSRAIGSIVVFNQLGILIAFFAGGALKQAFDMDRVFLSGALVGFVGFILAFMLPKHNRKAHMVHAKELLAEFKSRKLYYYSALAAVFQFVLFATVFSFTNKAAEALGAGPSQISLSSALCIVFTILSCFMVSMPFYKKLKFNILVPVLFLLMSLHCVITAFSHSLVLIYVAQCLTGVSSAMTSIFMAKAIEGVDGGRKSTAMGIFQSLYSFGIVLGPIVMGAMSEAFGLKRAFLLLALLPVAGAVAAAFSPVINGRKPHTAKDSA